MVNDVTLALVLITLKFCLLIWTQNVLYAAQLDIFALVGDEPGTSEGATQCLLLFSDYPPD